jgi:hypothetical protein
LGTRTTRSTVIFKRPFQLIGMDGVAPAGSYQLAREEEKLDTLTCEAWRQTAVILEVRRAGVTEYLPVDPEELREALARDGEPDGDIATPPGERSRRVRGLLRLRSQRP